MSEIERSAFDSEDLFSDEAKAILARARKYGTPFTRQEIIDIAPGAAWDEFSRWPKTVAKLDPIRELVRAGFIEQHDEQLTAANKRGQRNRYKRWRLTGRESVPTLAELLDAFYVCAAGERESRKAEIIDRFGRSW